jgi:probable phosphoglycerate mutase
LARTLLYLVRHAEQKSSPGSGEEPGAGLSAIGQQQARHLGRRLAGVPFDVIRHSPLPRAAETARIVSGYLPGVPVAESGLLTDLTPVPPPGADDWVPEEYRWFPGTVPDDERDISGSRLDAAYAGLATAGDADRCELLITHNFVIGWFVRRVLDAPWWRWMGLNQFNGALTIVKIATDAPPALVTFNDIGHLPADIRGNSPILLHS